jgi:hypothetical protein
MTKSRTIRLCTSVTLLLGAQILPGRASDQRELPAVATQTTSSVAVPRNPERPELSSTLPQEYILTLSEIRDIGLTLQLIKGEAIHIYLEAARKPVPLNGDAKLIEPKSIPASDIVIDRTCEPVRHDWLVFFIGTMEPIVHLLSQGVEQVENEEAKLVIPNVEKEIADKLWHEWAQGIQDLDKDLDTMSELLNSEKIDNKVLADQAVAIFNSCQKLEDVRVRVHKVVQESEPK